ncbi:hypothetical protein EJ06DRAFT_559829 [Trichodelitschia bisporula]|uniref:Uncharacterized protein n=1 Tax=Trichodelitschia bisporula TaxID=703511 RepID=A0A6G1HLK8_9PEZI|nr:hypothetical protein EJ06DRAFT_559829 [Trichodelitschia bisporula]
MNGVTIIVLFVVLPLLLLFIYLALSSCLGDSLRRRDSVRPATFGTIYARSLAAGQGGWEQIEMQDVVNRDDHERGY